LSNTIYGTVLDNIVVSITPDKYSIVIDIMHDVVIDGVVMRIGVDPNPIVHCGYLSTTNSITLNTLYIYPE